jgi:hypothetical protein
MFKVAGPFQSGCIDRGFERDLWYDFAAATLPTVLKVDIAEPNPFIMACMLSRPGNYPVGSLCTHAAREDYLNVVEINGDSILMFHDFLPRSSPGFPLQ